MSLRSVVVVLTLQHIFMWEQEEYNKEGIDWTGVTFADNKPVLVSSSVFVFLIAGVNPF